MKKVLLICAILLTILSLNGCSWFNKAPRTLDQAQTKEDKLKWAKAQVDNYFAYTTAKGETDKLSKLSDADIYYYANDNKRYYFPDLNIFKTWFKNADINTIKSETKEKMYETALGGNVTLRPGTLMMTETDPKIYLITGNGKMKIFGNLTLLEQLYGKDYKTYIVEIPNFFFTQYENQGAINQPEEYPEIKTGQTINLDKNL